MEHESNNGLLVIEFYLRRYERQRTEKNARILAYSINQNRHVIDAPRTQAEKELKAAIEKLAPNLPKIG